MQATLWWWGCAASMVFSDASYYKWEAKFGGMEVSDAKRLRALDEENNKLKRLLADALLDNAALKDVVSRKW
jgi:putative transposase